MAERFCDTVWLPTRRVPSFRQVPLDVYIREVVGAISQVQLEACSSPNRRKSRAQRSQREGGAARHHFHWRGCHQNRLLHPIPRGRRRHSCDPRSRDSSETAVWVPSAISVAISCLASSVCSCDSGSQDSRGSAWLETASPGSGSKTSSHGSTWSGSAFSVTASPAESATGKTRAKTRTSRFSTLV